MIDVYKEDVLEAIETEPLQFSSWISHYNRWDHDCSVCAIGAILRGTGIQNDNIEKRAVRLTTSHGAIDPRDISSTNELPTSWQNAISFVWESLRGDHVMNNQHRDIEEARVNMLDWCEDNLPEDEVLFSL